MARAMETRWRWPPVEFNAAFADDGVVTLREMMGELVDAGDAAGFHNLLLGGVRPAQGDILANRAVEQKRFL